MQYILSGRSYRKVGGGLIHPGARATLDKFKEWLGDDNFTAAKKAGRFEEVKTETIKEEKPAAAKTAAGAKPAAAKNGDEK